MKGALSAAIITIVLVLVILVILTINNYQARKNEIQENLALTLDQAMETLKTGERSYSPDAYQELVSDILQQIILQVNSDSDINVNILNVDLDHGIVDIEAVEYYKWANTKKSVSERRTVVLEEYHKPEDVVVTDIVDEEKTIHVVFKSNNIIHAEVNVKYGESVNKPVDPEVTNYYFKGWYIEGDPSKELLTEADWISFCPAEDMTLIAEFSGTNE